MTFGNRQKQEIIEILMLRKNFLSTLFSALLWAHTIKKDTSFIKDIFSCITKNSNELFLNKEEIPSIDRDFFQWIKIKTTVCGFQNFSRQNTSPFEISNIRAGKAKICSTVHLRANTLLSFGHFWRQNEIHKDEQTVHIVYRCTDVSVVLQDVPAKGRLVLPSAWLWRCSVWHLLAH